jgi:hypothetical protein
MVTGLRDAKYAAMPLAAPVNPRADESVVADVRSASKVVIRRPSGYPIFTIIFGVVLCVVRRLVTYRSRQEACLVESAQKLAIEQAECDADADAADHPETDHDVDLTPAGHLEMMMQR